MGITKYGQVDWADVFVMAVMCGGRVLGLFVLLTGPEGLGQAVGGQSSQGFSFVSAHPGSQVVRGPSGKTSIDNSARLSKLSENYRSLNYLR